MSSKHVIFNNINSTYTMKWKTLMKWIQLSISIHKLGTRTVQNSCSYGTCVQTAKHTAQEVTGLTKRNLTRCREPYGTQSSSALRVEWREHQNRRKKTKIHPNSDMNLRAVSTGAGTATVAESLPCSCLTSQYRWIHSLEPCGRSPIDAKQNSV